jgi:hypothetical protein
MKANIIFLCATLVSLVACDPPERDPAKIPSSDEVRTYMGLVDGNCWRYRLSGSRTYLTMSVDGPNTIAVAGRSLYAKNWLSDSGDVSREEYFDTSYEGELRMAREIDGRGTMAEVRTYLSEPLPLVGRFDFDAMDKMQFAEAIFKTTATPMGLEKEDHQWTVINTAATGTKHDGTSAEAVEISGQRGTSASRYTLIPGYGYSKYTDATGRSYQICDACVSDKDGGCSDMQCAQLKNCD